MKLIKGIIIIYVIISLVSFVGKFAGVDSKVDKGKVNSIMMDLNAARIARETLDDVIAGRNSVHKNQLIETSYKVFTSKDKKSIKVSVSYGSEDLKKNYQLVRAIK